MATVIPFTPSNANTPPFTANIVIDGSPYILSAYWLVYAQRWYVKLTTNVGSLIQFAPLIDSPDDYNIELFPGLFQESVVYRSSSNQIEIGVNPSTTSSTEWSRTIDSTT